MSDSSGNPEALVIERIFDAPVQVIWQMWTDPQHFANWYGPVGASIPVAKMDVRVGGTRLICLEVPTPGGPMQMWFAGEYRVVDEHARLVYTEAGSDEAGNLTSPSDLDPPQGHRSITEVQVRFEDLGDRTRVILTHVGIPAGSPGAVGWAMALDKLADQVRGCDSRPTVP